MKIKNFCTGSFVSCAVLVMCSASALPFQIGTTPSDTSGSSPGAVAPIESPSKVSGVVALTDALHVKKEVLVSPDDVHYYSFTSVRGQKVVVARSHDFSDDVFWDIEVLDDGKWQLLPEKTMVFSGLEPGSQIQIRVSYKKGAVFVPQPYGIVFGSYPVLKEFKLRDQYGIKRIPSGHTQPAFLLVQGYTEANIEAYFVDSLDTPLKGAMGRLDMSLAESRIKPISRDVVSDENGRVTEVVSFERCYGGRESGDINYIYGPGTWRSYYYVGSYRFTNVVSELTGTAAASEGDKVFGHVCHHRKIKS
ncbi:hypothetical protein [Pseudomonas sp. W2-17]|uniref:hypothetical protein n=1 Tax=Pseudomonas sp. W2-17 TaxID=3058039 RepID=UPI0034E06244